MTTERTPSAAAPDQLAGAQVEAERLLRHGVEQLAPRPDEGAVPGPQLMALDVERDELTRRQPTEPHPARIHEEAVPRIHVELGVLVAPRHLAVEGHAAQMLRLLEPKLVGVGAQTVDRADHLDLGPVDVV